MYHIKKDRRSLTSAEMLYDALTACLREKPFAEISITEVTARAMVGRSTFYRNFDDLTDILRWKCSGQLKQVMLRYREETSILKRPLDLLEYVLDYWFEHSQALESLSTIGRADIIYDCIQEGAALVRESVIEQLHFTQAEYDYFLAASSGIVGGILLTWLKNGRKESAHELTEYIRRYVRFELDDEQVLRISE